METTVGQISGDPGGLEFRSGFAGSFRSVLNIPSDISVINQYRLLDYLEPCDDISFEPSRHTRIDDFTVCYRKMYGI
ncbi:MAG: hypothetical protein GY774_29395 [Planctomycetes bacterium]|nr:hypothetical protein [Planctomycetota bacterium]